jgi:hypothetical protein
MMAKAKCLGCVGCGGPDCIERQAPAFVTKDSGKREEYASGMVRDTNENKPRYDLLIPSDVPYDQTLLHRWALLLHRGSLKYSARNWEKARGPEEMARFKESAFRHFMQWYCGELDEDHASAVLFNVNGFETTKWRLENGF